MKSSRGAFMTIPADELEPQKLASLENRIKLILFAWRDDIKKKDAMKIIPLTEDRMAMMVRILEKEELIQVTHRPEKWYQIAIYHVPITDYVQYLCNFVNEENPEEILDIVRKDRENYNIELLKEVKPRLSNYKSDFSKWFDHTLLKRSRAYFILHLLKYGTLFKLNPRFITFLNKVQLTTLMKIASPLMLKEFEKPEIAKKFSISLSETDFFEKLKISEIVHSKIEKNEEE